MENKQINDIAQHLAESQADVMLPYPTADKIIAEVMKNGKNSRESVMMMLLEYLTDSLKSREKGLAFLKEELSKLGHEKSS